MLAVDFRDEAFGQAASLVENFNLDSDAYSACSDQTRPLQTGWWSVKGQGSTFFQDSVSARVWIDYGTTKNCTVFLGKNLKGHLRIGLHKDNSMIYVGSDCRLDDLEIRSWGSSDLVVIGNHVTCNQNCKIIAGRGAYRSGLGIVLGDDCMLANDVVIRNSDAHPIIMLDDNIQVNQPSQGVFIGQHTWLGERASVLKGVTVGGCSVLGFGAVVTKDVPRFSLAVGSPAQSITRANQVWSRSMSERHLMEAKRWASQMGE